MEVAAGRPLPVALARELQWALRTATGRHEPGRLRRLLAVFSAFSLSLDPTGGLSVGLDIAPERGTADSGDLGVDLTALFEALGEAARDLGIGALVLVDELQEAQTDELRALNTAVHQLGQGERPLPVIVVAAGLPSLPRLLAEVTSYAERMFDYRRWVARPAGSSGRPDASRRRAGRRLGPGRAGRGPGLRAGVPLPVAGDRASACGMSRSAPPSARRTPTWV